MNNITYSNETIKDSKLIHLSTQGSSGIILNGDYKSYARYDLKSYIDFENDDTIEYITVSMPYAVLTNSNYIINETNNILNVLVGTTPMQFIFHYGNYSATSFISHFLAMVGNDWNLTIDTTTNKFALTHKHHSFTLLNSTIDYILGYTGSIVSSPIANNQHQIIMPRSCNFLPVARFNIKCDVINCGIILNNNSSFSDVLMSIPNVSKLNSQIVYENNEIEFLLKTYNINTITLSIQDDNGNYINFNGISSYFVLRFNIYRKGLIKPMKFSNLIEYINSTDKLNNDEN
jgi:hypothetical protein